MSGTTTRHHCNIHHDGHHGSNHCGHLLRAHSSRGVASLDAKGRPSRCPSSPISSTTHGPRPVGPNSTNPAPLVVPNSTGPSPRSAELSLGPAEPSPSPTCAAAHSLGVPSNPS
ncbi:hypothetical protein EV1_003090 [Malus domestica]